MNKKRSVIAVILLLIMILCNSSIVVASVVILVIHIIQLTNPSTDRIPMAHRQAASAIDGTYQYKSTSELLSELQEKQLKAEVSVLPSAVFQSGQKGSAGSCMVECETTSKVMIKADFSINGKIVATAPMIKPGQHVESVTLSSDVQPGAYTVTVCLNCYDLNSKALMTKADMGITVTVK